MASNQDGMNIKPEQLGDIKNEIVKSTLKFFMQELTENCLDAEQKESLSVAKQCLEACYEIEEDGAAEATDLIKLFHHMNIPPPKPITPEMEAEAEKHKIEGNDAMKEGNYQGAINFYNEAISLNPKKAIYYCNRAAAYSRLNMDQAAIDDCKEAIKLDPKYGKAYGRLGIAYSNMSMYVDAADAYRNALTLDPTNTSYEANLKLAIEKIKAPPAGSPSTFDFSGFMNNPALLSMASQMLNDPAFRNMVSGIMSSGAGGDPNLDSFVEVGQQLAEHMQANSPNVLETLRQSFAAHGAAGHLDLNPTPNPNPPEAPPSNDKPEEKKND